MDRGSPGETRSAGTAPGGMACFPADNGGGGGTTTGLDAPGGTVPLGTTAIDCTAIMTDAVGADTTTARSRHVSITGRWETLSMNRRMTAPFGPVASTASAVFPSGRTTRPDDENWSG